MKTNISVAKPAVKALAVAVALAIAGPAVAAGAKEKAKVDVDVDRPMFSDNEWRDMARTSLALEVQSKLFESASLRGADITVEVDDDRKVTLEGTVATKQQKARAERIAARTRGVRKVENDLDVDADMKVMDREMIDDEVLAKRVATAIAQQLGTGTVKESWFFGYQVEGRSQDGDDWKLEVDADDGEIELDGELPKNADVQKVLQTVRRMPAVRSIENDIDSNERRHLSYAPAPYRTYAGVYRAHPATLVSHKGEVDGHLVCQFTDSSMKVTGRPMKSN